MGETQNMSKDKNGKSFKKNMNAKQLNKKFNQYKEIVKEGFKKSWEDVVSSNVNKKT